MIYNILIDENKFEDIAVVEDKDIDYIKNELEKIKIINDYTKDMLVESNININKIDNKIDINNNDLQIAYDNKKNNIINKIYMSILGVMMSIYFIIKR
jgi:hypothetical protein